MIGAALDTLVGVPVGSTTPSKASHVPFTAEGRGLGLLYVAAVPMDILVVFRNGGDTEHAGHVTHYIVCSIFELADMFRGFYAIGAL